MYKIIMSEIIIDEPIKPTLQTLTN